MKTHTINANEMPQQPFFGRFANLITHSLTGGASTPTAATTHDHKEISMKSLILTILSATLLLAVPYARAQQGIDNRIPTNLSGVFTYASPPSGFDPLTASDDRLAAYGFPPRPDKNAEGPYAAWEKAMKASKHRVVPVLKVTNRYHGPNIAVGKVEDASATSSNWSGMVDTTSVTSYGPSSIVDIGSEFVVPVAAQANGVCTGGWDYSSSWVGIDGWNANAPDVLQAGTESDAYCSGGVTNANYDAWFEWFPYPETVISGFSVPPGTDMWVRVWSTTATAGHAYLLNYNTNTAVTIAFSAPPGTNLIGNSAEWIVERPGLGSGGLATLTNYVSDYFSGSFASAETCGNFGFCTFYSPITPGAIAVTMLDNSGSPISSPTALLPQLQCPGFYCTPLSGDIEFQDEGSAR
jgi:hypothetical protein